MVDKELYKQVEAAMSAKIEAQEAFETSRLALERAITEQYDLWAGVEVCTIERGLVGVVRDFTLLFDGPILAGNPALDLIVNIAFMNGPSDEVPIGIFWDTFRLRGPHDPVLNPPTAMDLRAMFNKLDLCETVSAHKKNNTLYGEFYCSKEESVAVLTEDMDRAGWSYEVMDREQGGELVKIVRVYAVPG